MASYLVLQKPVGDFMHDTISDLLTRIRNASAARIPTLQLPHSRMKEAIAQVLRREGFVSEVAVDGLGAKRVLRVRLKYDGTAPTIDGLRRVSKPGIRVYVRCSEIPTVRSGLGVSVISSPEGVISGREARKRKIGGELICTIW